MSLKPLLQALHGFSHNQKAFLPHFGRLTLQDLGFYVEEVHAMKYFEDQHYNLAHHAFMLENALKQTRFVAGSAGDVEKAFFPFEWKNKPTDRLGCSTLCDSQHVTLCWFVVPPGGVLPLHDHPTMSVWQRVLFGKMRVTSVDWVLPEGEPTHASGQDALDFATERAAKGGEGVVVFADTIDGSDEPLTEDQLLTGIHHFSPSAGGGVVHELENVDTHAPALFVDVIAPPYLQPPSQIPCTYYTLRRSGTPAEPAKSTAAVTRGVRVDVRKGDRVTLTPRPSYYGPDMNAFAHLSDN